MGFAEAKKVWLLKRGGDLVGVFSSHANAALVAARLPETSICAVVLDPAVEPLRAGLTQWRVLMLRAGHVEKAEADEALVLIDGEPLVVVWRWQRAATCFNPVVWARDRDHAVQLADELRTKAIATGKWDT